MSVIRIIGGGLAGCEAAWQAARRGVRVVLHEMRPSRATAVHKTDRLAELVCSNSFRGDKLDNAVGLLKEEMRRLDSLVMRAAAEARVPAGAALAVDRHRFADVVTSAITAHPLITIVREEVPALPEPGGPPVIVATGPLTSDSLSASIQSFVGRAHLSFYDAISPIVLAETIDTSKVFRASRWDRSIRGTGVSAGTHAGTEVRRHIAARMKSRSASAGPACSVDDGQGDYLNCPFTREEYDAFYDALVHAESATVHDFDTGRVLRGVSADRGDGPSGPRHAAVRTDEARRARRSAHGTAGVRGRAAAAGHSRRRSLQPRRLSDAVEVGRAGARAADDSRARVGRVRALRDGAPEHLHQRADGSSADVADTHASGFVLRGAGQRRRGIRRVRRVRVGRGPKRGGVGAAASTPRPRRARQPSARWPTTSRTRMRRTISPPTSRSASCLLSRTRPADARRRAWTASSPLPRGRSTISNGG